MTQPASYEIYDSSHRPHAALDELLSLIRYRELLAQFISRAIKTRYKRSVLGVLWTLLNPLLTAIVLTLVYSNLFRFAIPHYPIYLLAGLTAWHFFAGATNQAMSDMMYNGGLLNRIYMPRSLYVVSAVCTQLVNLGFAFIPVLLIALVTGAPINWTLVMVIPAVLLLAIFSLGMGLILATAAAFFADMLPVYDVLLTIWLYATPLIYPIDIIPVEWVWLFKLNPLYYLVDLFRMPLFTGTMPSLSTWLISSAIAIVTLLVGWFLFTSKSNEYAYRI
jgi:ABC-type polysaccharide/polyol phosphate export permease